MSTSGQYSAVTQVTISLSRVEERTGPAGVLGDHYPCVPDPDLGVNQFAGRAGEPLSPTSGAPNAWLRSRGHLINRCEAAEESGGNRQPRGRTVVERAGMPQVGVVEQDDRPGGHHDLHLGRVRAHLAAEG